MYVTLKSWDKPNLLTCVVFKGLITIITFLKHWVEPDMMLGYE